MAGWRRVAVAALAAGLLAWLGRPPRPPRRVRAERYRLRVGGLRLHARRWAGGAVPEGRPPVVLVHGLGMSGRYMVPLAEWLAPEFHVHAPDLPGFGGSDAPGHVLSVPELADALAAWMAAAGIGGRVALIGNSLGCEIALAFALRHPGRVARLVLQGPTPDAAVRPAWAQLWRFLLLAPLERWSIAWVAATDYLRAGPRRFARSFRHMMRHEVEEMLPRVAAPALVVLGARDLLVPRAWAERMAARLPRGRLVLVPGAAHGMTWSHPRRLRDAVRPFLLGEGEGRPPAPARG
ncbi:alpha/beta fold hydrolase [Crenalkalicoccus roseus]|uniref:alpha/beta fold hydrolase n=1 Tax=Crenalkalicoccus roseus TaxID=1485588 RepID=UPI001081A42D|nr:alpha/beta fold hydrolase [Crenalkalicoccus roseus]